MIQRPLLSEFQTVACTIDTSAQVIIPKASTSKAIVFCDGMKGRCFLSDSFNRMMELQAMRNPSTPTPTLLASSPLAHTSY